MSRHRLFESLTIVAVLAAAVSIGGAAPAPAANADPLARPEFDNELTFELRRVDTTELFGRLARASDVPFVLDFERDPDLMGSFNVKNMSVRAILASLAGGNGFEYAASEQGLVVRRVGFPRAAEPRLVGAWPGVQYELQFTVWKSSGGERKLLSSPRVTTQVNQLAELKQGIASKTPRGPRNAMLVAKIRPTGESANGVDLDMEFVSTRPVDDARYIDEHHFAKMTVGRTETALFKTEDGVELLLKDWRAIEPTKKSAALRRAADGGPPVYDFGFVVRDPHGEALSTPQVATRLNEALEVRQGVQHSSGSDRLFMLKLVPTNETSAGLEVSIDLSDRLSRGKGRYLEDHSSGSISLGTGETMLFRTEDGYEFAVQRWTKR
jgi:hypothetical protein